MSDMARERHALDPGPIQLLINKHAAGVQPRPSASQLTSWMNNESAVPEQYHVAIRDTVAKMSGHDCMIFVQNAGSSIRGFAHLLHATGAFTDRVVHYVDQFSDIGDNRPRWDNGYAFSRMS